MKIFDFEKIIFRLNVLAVGVVFTLVIPSARIIASWYPENEIILWFFPLAVIGISSVLWLVWALSLPKLIKWGIFDDRRQEADREREALTPSRRFLRIFAPMLTLGFEILVLIFMGICLVAFMNSKTLETLFKNLP